MEVVAVAILQRKNFKVVYVKLFLVKHNSIFGAGYYNQKNDIFPFTDILSLHNIF